MTASVGGFVPKPHTPFQWFGQNTVDELQRKVHLLRDATRSAKGVQLKWHDPRATLAEGIASRGDRRIGAVIEHVWRAGGTFQEWSECFDVSRWHDAMAACGLSIDWYVHRHRTEDEVLPWAHVTAGLHADFLWHDWQAALAESGVEDCRWTPCYDCGVCTGYGIEHVVASATPPAGGSQGTGQDRSVGGRRIGGADPRAGRVMTHLRVRFTKLGKVRFTSHRDVARMFERAFRRADLPLAYTEGFSPRPRISFGLALSTGYESLAEYLDADLQVGHRIRLRGHAAPAHRGTPWAVSTSWPWRRSTPMHCLSNKTSPRRRGASSSSPTSVRRSKRPHSLPLPLRRSSPLAPARASSRPMTCVPRSWASLCFPPATPPTRPANVVLTAELATQPRALRPAELIGAVWPAVEDVRVLRTHQWIERDGVRWEPLPSGATDALHAEVRAS